MELENKDDKYNSFLAEAYMVVLLYTVVSLYGKQQGDLEEDFSVVQTRMDFCVRMQPKNPAIYKMRADFLSRFGALADREALVKDYTKAIQLLEEDEDGKNLNTYGVDPKQQRKYLLAFCHYQMGGLMHRMKDFPSAIQHYEASLQNAEAEFVHLPDTHYSMCILTIMRAKKTEEKSSVMYRAATHYKQGMEAERKLLKWLPFSNADVSKRLAKELLKKFAKTGMDTPAS